MTYQEFLNETKTQLSIRMEEDAILDIQQVVRNNGMVYDGLIIIRPDINISPTIYLNPYYHRYLEGVSLEDIYDDILKTYRSHLPEQNFDTSIFTDFSSAKERIVMRLVNYEKNQKLLEHVPHFCYLDFAVIFYCLLTADEKQQASILIYNHHLKYWDVDNDMLYRYAMENTPRLLPYRLEDMSGIVHAVLAQLPDDVEEPDCPMYILTNTYRTNGATVILYDNLLKEIADKFDSDLVVLPSSIHEVLLLPVDADVEMEMFNDMVAEVNDTQLADDEVLSGHAYFFSRKEGILSMGNLSK